MYLHNMIFLFLIVKIYFWTKHISKILTTSLDSLYCQKCSNNSESASISTIEIGVGGNNGQGKFRSVSK